MKKEDFSPKLKSNCPSDEEIERIKVFIKLINIERGEQLIKLYCKSDVIQSGDFFENFIKLSVKEFDINLLYCVSLPGYAWQCGMQNTDIKMETLQDKEK